MSAQQKIAALEGLLARIEANRALPRVAYSASVAAPEEAVATFAAVVPAPSAFVPSTVEAAPEEIEAEDVELFDDEIVEVTVESEPPADVAPQVSDGPDFELRFSDPAEIISAPPPSELEADLTGQASAPGAEMDFSDVSAALEPAAPDAFEEEAPASSKRAKLTPTSMSEALAEAASQAEREVPLKTPPPESGPQAATPVQIPALGRLPSLPPEPAEELNESAQVTAESVDSAAAFAALEPEVATRTATTRAATEANVLRIVGAASAFRPQSFVELLDATLELAAGSKSERL